MSLINWLSADLVGINPLRVVKEILV